MFPNYLMACGVTGTQTYLKYDKRNVEKAEIENNMESSSCKNITLNLFKNKFRLSKYTERGKERLCEPYSNHTLHHRLTLRVPGTILLYRTKYTVWV